MTIKYECNECRQVVVEGPEVHESSSVLLQGVLFLTKHASETGHRDFGYKSDGGSQLRIDVFETGAVAVYDVSKQVK